MQYHQDWNPHPSHQMEVWENTIVTIISTPRFGRFRKCQKCDAEQAETAAGRAAHRELAEECCG